jgi:lipid II:glycine glycyltransferase (peptidoglycan interpeptide bridge formation enzyme)
LSRLVQYAHDHRIVALDLFPNLPASDSKSRDWLVTHGFRPVYNRLAFHTQTYILNCARSDEELLSCMEKRTRWSLRRAQRMGVSVRHGTDEQLLDLFFMVYSIANPSPQSKMFFENVNRILGTRGLARFFVSEVKGDCAAAMFALMFGPTIFYIWGGTNPDYRSQHAGTLLHWEAIRWGRSNGFTLYDFHGALVEDIDKFGADEKTSNVALFKRGFGGSLLKYMPQHRAVFSSFKYTMANAIRRAASVVH